MRKDRPQAGVPLPVSYYRSVIDGQSWNRLILVTEDLDDPVFARLVELYSPTVRHGGAVADLTTLIAARRLVMSTSTFSWWGAVLGQADEVHFPQWGEWHPQFGRSDVDLMIPEDRVILHDMGTCENWPGGKDNAARFLDA